LEIGRVGKAAFQAVVTIAKAAKKSGAGRFAKALGSS